MDSKQEFDVTVGQASCHFSTLLPVQKLALTTKSISKSHKVL